MATKNFISSNLGVYLDYLAELIHEHILRCFDNQEKVIYTQNLSFPTLKNGKKEAFTHFLKQNKLSKEESICLLIALAPHVQADFYDRIINNALPQAGDFPQLGGARGKNFRGFLARYK